MNMNMLLPCAVFPQIFQYGQIYNIIICRLINDGMYTASIVCVAARNGCHSFQFCSKFQCVQRINVTTGTHDVSIPIPSMESMYGIFTYIWLIFMGNVGKYTIHGWSGIYLHVILGTNDFSPLTKTQVVFSSSLSTCGHGVDVGKCPDGHWPHGGVVQPMGQHDNDAESCKKCNHNPDNTSNTSKGSWEDTCFFSERAI